MKTYLSYLFLFILSFIFHYSTLGAIIYIPNDQPTIQAGIDQAIDGDTVLVLEGTYQGDGNRDIQVNGKAISIISSKGPYFTIINCQGSSEDYHGGISFYAVDEQTLLDGFSIINGYNYESSASISILSSSVIISNCILSKNVSLYDGGAMLCDHSSPVIINCFFRENWATYYGGSLSISVSNPEIVDCIFEINSAGLNGGGIFSQSSDPVIVRCTFITNSANSYGGGIYLENSNPQISLCTFENNVSEDKGGGIYSSSSEFSIASCNFINNNSSTHGGGLYCVDSSYKVINCLFNQNIAESGGGIFCEEGYNNNFLVFNCNFTQNQVLQNGGACYFSECSPQIFNCIFKLNTAEAGGAIFASNFFENIRNCTFSMNSADFGGGMQFHYSTPTITDCIFWTNSASIGTEISLEGSSDLNISYSDIKNGIDGINVCDSCDLSIGPNFLNNDPAFVSGIDGDYYLSQTEAGQTVNSICVDKGSNLSNQICIESIDPNICFDELSTRTDEVNDMNEVDMGYHFLHNFIDLSMDLSPISSDCYSEGDLFDLNAQTNSFTTMIVDLYCVLDIYGDYYFYPNWTNVLQSKTIIIYSGLYNLNLLRFIWPSVSGSAIDIKFYSVLTEQGSLNLLSNVSSLTFCYDEIQFTPTIPIPTFTPTLTPTFWFPWTRTPTPPLFPTATPTFTQSKL